MKFLLNFLHPILKLYALFNGINYYFFDKDFEKFGKKDIQNFIQKVEMKKSLEPLIKEKISKVDSLEISAEAKHQKIYNIEYSESNYGFF